MDMIDEYMEFEKERAVIEAEKTKRPVLEQFAFFIDTLKKGVWKLEHITEEDGRKYYSHLKENIRMIQNIRKNVMIVNHFMEFALRRKWITGKPWQRLFKQKKGRVLKIDEGVRKRLIKYLSGLKPLKKLEKRDKAMLLLRLRYDLKNIEISRLTTGNYTGKEIQVKTKFEWRNRTIELDNDTKKAIDDYLSERTNIIEEDPLFPNYLNRMIYPDTIRNIVNSYIIKMEEE